jgi:gluconokinase
MIIVIMGVAGAGKSTVGQLLARELHSEFLDGDSLHSPENIAKMTQGIPLTDADRAPWLAAIHRRILESFQGGEGLVVACSALKRRYRDALDRGVAITLVYLKVGEELIRERLEQRKHHFMNAQMLASQFADLEEPADAIVIDAAVEPAVAIRQIMSVLPAATNTASRSC